MSVVIILVATVPHTGYAHQIVAPSEAQEFAAQYHAIATEVCVDNTEHAQRLFQVAADQLELGSSKHPASIKSAARCYNPRQFQEFMCMNLSGLDPRVNHPSLD